MSDSNDERYEQELIKQRQETEVRFWEEEEQQQAERRARKEAKVAEKRREEEERCQKEEAKRQMKAEEKWRRQRGGRHLPSGSRSTGSGHTGAEKKLVEEDESGTVGVSSVQGGDESDQLPPFDKKTTSLLSTQGDSRTMLREGRNGEGAGNRANGCG